MPDRSNIPSETASQTAGPYVHIGLMPQRAGITTLPPDLGTALVTPDVPGERVTVFGYIYDGEGALVRDAILEVAQCDAEGRRAHDTGAHPDFQGWARIATAFDTGLWQFETLRPGPMGNEAPHLALWIVARGINTGLHTRLYFDDAPEANAACPVFSAVPQTRRDTLLAKATPKGFRFDIHLQGSAETVFFDV